MKTIFNISKAELVKILSKMSDGSSDANYIEIEIDTDKKADIHLCSDFYRAYQKSAYAECSSTYMCCAGDNQK